VNATSASQELPPPGARAAEEEPPASRPAASLARWRPSRPAAIAFVVGLALTAALAFAALALYDRNEKRLLGLRARELGLVVTATVPSIQTPLASAAELAAATNGSVQKFRAFMAPYVGPSRQFVSASLWPSGTPRPAPSAVVGAAPALARLPAQARAFFARAQKTPTLKITGILPSTPPSLGYAFTAPARRGGFAVYAESQLPANRRSKLEGNSAFSDLNYVLYLGRSRQPSQLLVTSLNRLPMRGRQASERVPFGDSSFTLVVGPRGSLGGAFFNDLPWIIAVFGVLVALAAALLTDRLAQRRRQAERMALVLDRAAAENRQMYAEQRGIAQTLQHALLPDELPRLEGLRVSARYIPAASGIDVGGDWYDVIAADGHSALLVIGDVSGHGLRAATTMASLRYAALAYAAQESSPAALLAKLSDFVSAGSRDYFATVLCALIEVDVHRLTVASAGHLPPLLLDDGHARFVEFDVGAPIGVAGDEPFQQTTIEVPPSATLVAFTDGLVERRGEPLDTGLARLRSAAAAQPRTLEGLLAKLAGDLASKHHQEDTAFVGIQWQS
jgi:serine phosphatase RsbU (regulator of sigma subunit)